MKRSRQTPVPPWVWSIGSYVLFVLSIVAAIALEFAIGEPDALYTGLEE